MQALHFKFSLCIYSSSAQLNPAQYAETVIIFNGTLQAHPKKYQSEAADENVNSSLRYRLIKNIIVYAILINITR